jgi:hypothetical protein
MIDEKEYDRVVAKIAQLQEKVLKGKNYFDAVQSPLRFLSDLTIDNDVWEDLYKRRNGLSGTELKYYRLIKFAIMRILSNVESTMSYKDPKTLCSAYIPHKYGRMAEPLRDKKKNNEIEVVDTDGLVSPILAKDKDVKS